jgi:type IV fimbrial biogenesis protein FimT
MRPSGKMAGFTLIEAMIAVSLMAILMAIAVPSFNNAVLGSQLRASASDLSSSAFLARSEAIKRNTAVTLCMSANGTSCAATGGWEQGWIVLVGGATLHSQKAVSSQGLRISAAGITSINFQPTGAGASAATFTVCRATPSVGQEERVVTIDATGRPWIRRTSNGVCS